MVKSAVFAPMPSPSVRMATMEKARSRTAVRSVAEIVQKRHRGVRGSAFGGRGSGSLVRWFFAASAFFATLAFFAFFAPFTFAGKVDASLLRGFSNVFRGLCGEPSGPGTVTVQKWD